MSGVKPRAAADLRRHPDERRIAIARVIRHYNSFSKAFIFKSLVDMFYVCSYAGLALSLYESNPAEALGFPCVPPATMLAAVRAEKL